MAFKGFGSLRKVEIVIRDMAAMLLNIQNKQKEEQWYLVLVYQLLTQNSGFKIAVSYSRQIRHLCRLLICLKLNKTQETRIQ